MLVARTKDNGPILRAVNNAGDDVKQLLPNLENIASFQGDGGIIIAHNPKNLPSPKLFIKNRTTRSTASAKKKAASNANDDDDANVHDDRRPVASMKELLQLAEAAHVGKGEKTVKDTKIRKTLKISPSKIDVDWNPHLGHAVARFAREILLFPESQVHHLGAELHDVLIYQKGDFFAPHRDSYKIDGHVGTLSVLVDDIPGLTAADKNVQGGSVRFGVDHQVRVWNAGPDRRWAAWIGSVHHAVTQLQSGRRVVAVFNLILRPDETVLRGGGGGGGVAAASSQHNDFVRGIPLLRQPVKLNTKNATTSTKTSVRRQRDSEDENDTKNPTTLMTSFVPSTKSSSLSKMPLAMFSRCVDTPYLDWKDARNLRATCRAFDEYIGGAPGVLSRMITEANIHTKKFVDYWSGKALAPPPTPSALAESRSENLKKKAAPASSNSRTTKKQTTHREPPPKPAHPSLKSVKTINMILPLRNIYTTGGSEDSTVPPQYLWGQDRVIYDAVSMALGRDRVSVVPITFWNEIENAGDMANAWMDDDDDPNPFAGINECLIARDLVIPDGDKSKTIQPRKGKPAEHIARLNVSNSYDSDLHLLQCSFPSNTVCWSHTPLNLSSWRNHKEQANGDDSSSEDDDKDDYINSGRLLTAKERSHSTFQNDVALQIIAMNKYKDPWNWNKKAIAKREKDCKKGVDDYFRDRRRAASAGNNKKNNNNNNNRKTFTPLPDLASTKDKHAFDEELTSFQPTGVTGEIWGNEATFKIFWYRRAALCFVLGYVDDDENDTKQTSKKKKTNKAAAASTSSKIDFNTLLGPPPEKCFPGSLSGRLARGEEEEVYELC